MSGRKAYRCLLAIGILINIGVILLLASEDKDIARVEDWAHYESKSAGFSIEYPEGWQTWYRNLHDVEFEARFYYTKDAYISVVAALRGRAIVDLMEHTRADRQPLIVYHERVIRDMKFVTGEISPTEPAPMKIAGREAYCTTFEYRQWNGLMGQTICGMVVSTWNAGRHIAFKVVSPARDSDHVFAAFGHMIDSFQPGRGVD